MCLHFIITQSYMKKIIYRTLLFISVYGLWGGLPKTRKLGEKMKGFSSHNSQTVSRVTQQHPNPLHPQWFRNYKQKTDWWPLCPLPIVFFMENTGLTRTHDFSLGLISEQKVEVPEQKETHQRLPYESLCGPLLTVTYTCIKK